MANYQLYRSNVLLGGQMKYDVILNVDKSNNLYVSDFHITPISDKCPYNKNKKDTLLQYPHQENIVSYYKNIKSSFYKDFTDKSLTNLYPTLNKDSLLNTESTYEMGCKRSTHYQLYGKQFEFFCPIWLENLNPNETLCFTITLFTDEKQRTRICEKTLKFKEIINNNVHNRFISYFNDYISYILCRNNENVNDWVFDINKTSPSVIGLNVTSGKINHKKLGNIFNNLIRRERPVLETNNMIINLIPDNHLITKQLFNFNFCFNIEDIFTSSMSSSMRGGKFYTSINAYIETDTDDKSLQLVDFYSNHEFIPKNKIIYDIDRNNSQSDWYYEFVDKNKNVLDYLQDNNCIDLIHKNKILQNTIHWRTTKSGNIFNLYDGFGSVNDDIMFYYLDQETPDIYSKEYKSTKNQIWCNVYTLVNKTPTAYRIFVNDILNDLSNGKKYEHLFTHFKNNTAVKNIDINITKGKIKDFYVLMLTDKANDLIYDNFDDYEAESINLTNGTETVCKIYKKDIGNQCYYIIIFNIKHIQYIVPLSIFQNIIGKESKLECFKNIEQTYSGENINLQSSLSIYQVPSPSLSSKEINYYKIGKQKSIFRMLGKIQPMFIEKQGDSKNYTNFRYYKFDMFDDQWYEKNQFILYNQTAYKPTFPSIKYWCFGYNEENYEIIKNDLLEYHYFNFNKLIDLYPDMYIDYIPYNESGDYVGLDEAEIKQKIKEKVRELYKISDQKHIDYITSLYDYKAQFDGVYDNKYKYKIKINLK